MGTRSKRSERCPRCRLHTGLCICSDILRLDLATRLILVMHHREWAKPTATGPLALAALSNSELRIQGYQEQPLNFQDLDTEKRRTLLLYPGEEAQILSSVLLAKDPRPVNLVVPDGNWRQAARMGRRLPGLEHATMVRLPEGAKTDWGVRKECHPEGLATFEAIARALGIIESTAVQKSMEALFSLMVSRTLQTRG
ncbi:MAG: DTW domain-containing protein [Deltaproteobacteria bacterium]|nr:DTW domain-containing protein [Deltaproteobacteria bacterium]